MNLPAINKKHLSLAAVLALLGAATAGAESQHEFLVFPSVDGFNTFSESDPSVDDSSANGALDLLYAFSGTRFRFLGEFLWSSDEAEFERLQAGVRTIQTASSCAHS